MGVLKQRHSITGDISDSKAPRRRFSRTAAAAGRTSRRAAPSGFRALTKTQLGILRARALGRTRKEIAFSLGLSLKTVEYHFSRIYRHLGISEDIGLTHFAIQRGLIEVMRFDPAGDSSFES